jgi:hypothetical protein
MATRAITTAKRQYDRVNAHRDAAYRLAKAGKLAAARARVAKMRAAWRAIRKTIKKLPRGVARRLARWDEGVWKDSAYLGGLARQRRTGVVRCRSRRGRRG